MRSLFAALPLVAIFGAGLAACTAHLALEEPSVEVDAGVPPPEDAAVDADAGAAPLSFSACPGGYSGACAKIEVPLDWTSPSGKQVGVLVDKISSVSRPKRQVWLLQGGPGGSAAGMIPIAQNLAGIVEDAELLTLEHRGVGASNRLGCPTFEAAHPELFDGSAADDLDDTPCFEEIKARFGAELPFYTTTNAARDLAHAIERMRRPGVPVFVYGVSYGTLWAQRFMQVAPEAAAGVILDSIVAPDAIDLTRFDAQADGVVAKAAEQCAADSACSAALGADPWARIRAAKAKIGQGHCPDAGLTDASRRKLVPLVQIRQLLGYGFSFWHRFDRCTAEDAAALKAFLGKSPFQDPTQKLFSPGLYANVAFSELWPSPSPTDDELTARFADGVFAAGDARRLAQLRATWPTYPADEFVGKYPTTTIPVLVLAGTYDAQTTIETQERARPHFAAPGQSFVVVPTAGHAVINQSPMTTLGGPPRICGLELVAAFLSNPTAPLNTSCTTQISSIEFARPEPEVSFFFGTDDMWLAAPVRPSTAPAPIDAYGWSTRFPGLH